MQHQKSNVNDVTICGDDNHYRKKNDTQTNTSLEAKQIPNAGSYLRLLI